jgi:proline racemase/trans-L-3-hydroxyproline dehydratase
MKVERFFSVVDSHTAGMPTRVVIGGGPKIPGKTMIEKRNYFRDNLDSARLMLTREPRGGKVRTWVAYLVSPTLAEADAGVILMNGHGYGNMCGHAIIGIVTTLVEMGMVPVKEPVTEVTLELPAGLIRTRANVTNGVLNSVTFQNIPAFLVGEYKVSIPELGDIEVDVDVAFGGNFYLYVSAEQLGVKVEQKNLDELQRRVKALISAADSQVPKPQHPTNSDVRARLGAVMICGTPVAPEADQKNILTGGRPGFDRSPCGTGTCGRMAALYAKGKLRLNEEFVNESIIGSIFRGRLIQEVKVGQYTAVIPEVTGSAYITGINSIISTADDPFKDGFDI